MAIWEPDQYIEGPACEAVQDAIVAFRTDHGSEGGNDKVQVAGLDLRPLLHWKAAVWWGREDMDAEASY